MPSHYYSDESEDDRYEDRRRDKGRDHRRRDPPKYEEEEIIEARRGGARDRDRDLRGPPAGALVPRRRDDSESSVEEIDRRHNPPRGYTGPRRSKSHGHYDDYDDRRYRQDRKRDRRRDYSSSSESSSPGPRRKPERRKSLTDQALAALGIGASAAAAAASKHGRDKDRDRDRYDDRDRDRRRRRDYSSSSSSRSRSRNKRPKDPKEQITQAAKAAITAGAAEAFRSRKEPGGWAGPKGRRVLTAAVGAAGIDGILNNDGKGGKLQTVQSVVGGLVGNRLINGKRGDESRSRSRSRRDDRSSSRGDGLAGLATGGLAAAAAKAFADRSKSKDRGRHYSDDDDYRPKRSKSVSDYARAGMAKITGRSKSRDGGRRRDYEDDNYAPRPRGGGGEGGDGIRSIPGSQSSSEDDVSSSEEDRERKQMGKKQIITAGLASVATIHAAQSVYKSIEGREHRRKEVEKGEMTHEEARKKKNKARLQDAAAIGIAALGIKGAYSEWKEMNEARHEAHELDIKKAERHARRDQRLIDAKKYGVTHGYGYAASGSSSAPDLHNDAASPPPTHLPSYSVRDGGGGGPPHPYMSGANGSVFTDAPHYDDGNPYYVSTPSPEVVSPPPPPEVRGPEPVRYH